jgi:hypothetical protein
MFDGLEKILNTTGYKNYCKTGGPLSMCTMYDDETKTPDVPCEFFVYVMKINDNKCDNYFNNGHCRCMKAQDEDKK